MPARLPINLMPPDEGQQHNAHCLQHDFVRAAAIAPYGNEANVAVVTREIVRLGFPVLESHKLGATDREHVAALLAYFNPPQGAVVLDAGCGVGAIAHMMTELRPDLRFSLLNISAAQLALTPGGLPKIRGDFHDMPIEAGTFDAVMFNFVLGHALLDRCIAEAARVLRLGGICLAYDLTTDDQSRSYVLDRLGYRPHGRDEMIAAARRHGLEGGVLAENPPYSIKDFITLFGASEFTRGGLDRTWPIVYRWTKAHDERAGMPVAKLPFQEAIAGD